jgi:hypothetical protein
MSWYNIYHRRHSEFKLMKIIYGLITGYLTVRYMWDVCEMSVRCLWDVREMSVSCMWDVSEMSVRCLWDVCEMSVRCPWFTWMSACMFRIFLLVTVHVLTFKALHFGGLLAKHNFVGSYIRVCYVCYIKMYNKSSSKCCFCGLAYTRKPRKLEHHE